MHRMVVHWWWDSKKTNERGWYTERGIERDRKKDNQQEKEREKERGREV